MDMTIALRLGALPTLLLLMQEVAGEGYQRNSARSGFDRVSTLIFVITKTIVTADEDLPMLTITDVSSLPADRDDTRRFLSLPFVNGLITLIFFL
jgi:hypothetical protein